MTGTSITIGIILLGFLLLAIAAIVAGQRARQREIAQRSAFVAGYRFPDELDRRLASRRPQLTPEQRSLVLEGLRQYFLVVLAARQGRIAKYLGMPSKAVDDAWHEFIVMTRDYSNFCTKAFGKFLHHRPARQMGEKPGDALANTLHQLKRTAPTGGAWAAIAGVPLLFALDRQLAIADGHVHGAAEMASLEARRHALVASGAEASTTASTTDDDADGASDGSSDGGGGCGGGCGGS